MSRRSTFRVIIALMIIAPVVIGYLWIMRHGDGSDVPPTPTYPATAFPSAQTPAVMSGDYYTVTGKAVTNRGTTKGTVTYCDPDELGRAQCAYGQLTHDMRVAAKARGRQEITVNPAGWPKRNPKVTIPANSQPGSKAYSGYLWNRSHLLADSLGGDAVATNLVTGTRTQNVGSTQTDGESSGGMAYTERIARNYLASDHANACPLYYAATAHYFGNELAPRTVTIDMQSCDKSIDMQVTVYNTAESFQIDYSNPQNSHAR